MRFEPIFLAGLLGEAVLAHENHVHLPRIVGGNSVRSRRGYEAVGPQGGDVKRGVEVGKRQEGRCGAEFGGQTCQDGECCSPAGWCGTSEDYCAAPDCQIDFGTGCDGNQIPAGKDTSHVPRPHLGSIPYGGVGIYDCYTAGEVAITFDDGPYQYTSDLLDKFASYGHVATFFITGNNLGKGHINDPSKPWRSIIQRMIAEGHQIASHTWSHQNASELSDEQMRNQMVYNEIAFDDILGFFPTYMRPPFSICPPSCQQILSDLGYHITYFDLDTEGYLRDGPILIAGSKAIWDAAIAKDPTTNSWLHIEHDLQYQVVYNFTDHMLSTLTAAGYKSVPVGKCLNDPCANWYRAGSGSLPTCGDDPATGNGGGGSGSGTGGSTGGASVSADGTCGAGVTCLNSQFGSCCSQYGWCGATDDHCGEGCQSGFGSCTSSSTPSSSTGSEPTTNPGQTQQISQDGTCTTDATTCKGSTFGSCCSQYGWCGSTTAHCGPACNPARGDCDATNTNPPASPFETTTSSSEPPTAQTPSPDGRCDSLATTCQDSGFGNCCSAYGWCGATASHCGEGCDPLRGRCGSGTSTSSAAAESVSTDGTCGAGKTCAGSGFGDCCSQYGYCGSTSAHCGTGCQVGFGSCGV